VICSKVRSCSERERQIARGCQFVQSVYHPFVPAPLKFFGKSSKARGQLQRRGPFQGHLYHLPSHESRCTCGLGTCANFLSVLVFPVGRSRTGLEAHPAETLHRCALRSPANPVFPAIGSKVRSCLQTGAPDVLGNLPVRDLPVCCRFSGLPIMDGPGNPCCGNFS